MKNLILLFALFISINISSQSLKDIDECICQPCGIPSHILVWMKTYDEGKCSGEGKLLDCGPDNISMFEYRDIDCGEPKLLGSKKLYNVNHNSAVFFDQNELGDKNYEFRLKNNLSTEITVFAVLVPHLDSRDIVDEEYGMLMPGIGRTRSLSMDNLRTSSPVFVDQEFDYGYQFGQNLFYGQNSSEIYKDEEERFGKIISYQTVLRPDRSMSTSSVMHQIFEFYSDDDNDITHPQTGHIPEIIIFDKVLEEEDRNKVETYLAVKYGISKEIDYVSCDNKVVWDVKKEGDYKFRKTGISNEHLWELVQSKSNTYYDEKIKEGRYTTYDESGDFSRNENRLLTIGIENESVKINECWKKSSYLIWGDEDSSLETTKIKDSNGFYIGRIWRMEEHTQGQDLEYPIRWVNFNEMINNNDVFESKCDVGTAASSTRIIEKGDLKFTLKNTDSTKKSFIGFSSDNSTFVNSEETDIEHGPFLFAIRAMEGKIQIVYDSDGDGYTDKVKDSGYEEGDAIILKYQRSENGHYLFESDDFSFESDYHCVNQIGVFAKMILDGGINVTSPIGSGYLKSPKFSTNVEYSSVLVKKFYDDLISEGLDVVPALLIDRDGADPFDFEKADRYRGVWSKHPDKDFDRLEFTQIDWSDIDLFTLSFIKCPENKVEVTWESCCDQHKIKHVAHSCFDNDLIYYELINKIDETNVLVNGYGLSNETNNLGIHPSGEYLIKTYFPNCDVNIKDISLVDDNIFPDDLIIPTEILFSFDSPTQIDAITLLANAGLTNNNLIFEWTLPDGTTIIEYTGILAADQLGTYNVSVSAYCQNIETTCIISDSVDIIFDCEMYPAVRTTYCCDCGYFEFDFYTSCPYDVDVVISQKGDILDERTITAQLGNWSYTHDLCLSEGTYHIEFRQGDEISQISIEVGNSPFLDVDLIDGNYEVTSVEDQQCFAIDQFINDLEEVGTLTKIGVVENNIETIINVDEDEICLSIGCYKLNFYVECEQEKNCIVEEEVCIICDIPGDLVITEIETCCDVALIEIEVSHPCSKSADIFIDGELYTTISNLDGVISEKLILEAGTYFVEVYFDSGIVLSEIIVIDIPDFSSINLFDEEIILLSNGEDEYCFDTDQIILDALLPANYSFFINGVRQTGVVCLQDGEYEIELKANCGKSFDEQECTISDQICIGKPNIEINQTPGCCLVNIDVTLVSTCGISGNLTILDGSGLPILNSSELQPEELTNIEFGFFQGIYTFILRVEEFTYTYVVEVEDNTIPPIEILSYEEYFVDGDTELCFDVTEAQQELFENYGYAGGSTQLIDNEGNIQGGSGDNCFDVEIGECYTLRIYARCADPTEGENLCYIEDEFCVSAEPTISECPGLKIDEPLEFCNVSEEFCIDNLPEDCSYQWTLIDNNGFVLNQSSGLTGYNFSIDLDGYEEGQYTVEVTFDCLEDYVLSYEFEFNSPFENILDQQLYCLGDDIVISSLIPDEYRITVQVLKDGLWHDILVGQVGLNRVIRGNKVGKYRILMYNEDYDCYQLVEYVVIKCDKLPRYFVDVNDLNCDSPYDGVSLSISTKLEFANEIQYNILRGHPENGNPKIIHFGSIKGNENIKLKLEPGKYYVWYIDKYKNTDIQEITVDDKKRIPLEIIDENVLVLNDKQLLIDASKYVTEPALYTWYYNNERIGNDAILNIEKSGKYMVKVKTQDCERSDLISVVDDQSLAKSNSNIKIKYRNPIQAGSATTFYVSQDKIETVTYVRLYSISGALIYSEEYSNRKDFSFDLSLPAGIYLIESMNSTSDISLEKILVFQ